MKFLSLSLLILGIGGAIASPFPAADDESVNYEGFPTDDVTCPDGMYLLTLEFCFCLHMLINFII